MPVMSCQKDNKPGFKWGRQGVCFTQSKDGLSPREQAARVGRAIAVQRAEALGKDQALGIDTLGGFLVPIASQEKPVQSLLPLDLQKMDLTGLIGVHQEMHRLWNQIGDRKSAETTEGQLSKEDISTVHEFLRLELENREHPLDSDDEITQAGTTKVAIDRANFLEPDLLEAYENHLRNNSFELPDEAVDVTLVAEHGKIKLWRLADGYGEWYFIYRDTAFKWLAQKMPDVRAFDASKELSGILNKETIQNIGWGDSAWDKLLATWVAESVSKREGETGMEIYLDITKQEEALIAKLLELIKQAKGIQFVIGRLKGETTTTVQSVLFDKENWMVARARAWLKDNDFKSGNLDETEERLRFRQRDPGDFKAGSFRTIEAGERRTTKRLPINDYGWTVQETFEAVRQMARKFTPEEAKLLTPSPDSSRTCGACRFFLRDPLGGPIGRCQVVEGEIAWFATSKLYISADAEAAASFAVMGRDQGAYTGDEREEEMERIAKRGVILKTDNPGFVLSPILVPDEPDLEGDVISEEEIESAAHEYMITSQNVGLMHQRIVRSKDAMLVESYIARGTHKIAGHTIKAGTWMGGFRIVNEKIRQAIKDGKLTGVSIGGAGLRTPLEG